MEFIKMHKISSVSKFHTLSSLHLCWNTRTNMITSLTRSHIHKQKTLSLWLKIRKKTNRSLYGNVSFPLQSCNGHTRFPLSEPNMSTYWSPPLWCNTHSTCTLTTQTYFSPQPTPKQQMTVKNVTSPALLVFFISGLIRSGSFERVSAPK